MDKHNTTLLKATTDKLLTKSDMNIIAFLIERGGTFDGKQQDIASELDLARPTVNTILKRLRRRGYISMRRTANKNYKKITLKGGTK